MKDNKTLLHEYYEMWNDHDFDKADTFLDEQIRFRGSLDVVASGIDEFKAYARMIVEAFPNLYHAVEISVFENDRAAAYVTYTGTHKGPLFHFPATGNRISYSGASFFHFRDGKIASINVLGDLNALYKQIGPA